MNNTQARLVNPVLTTAVQGIGDQALVGSTLFPRVDVSLRGGTTIVFNDTSDIDDDLIRAPGSSRKTYTPVYDGEDFAIIQRSLAAKVPVETEEEAQNGPGVSMSTVGISIVKKQLDKKLEVAQAKLARDASRYATDSKRKLTGANKWSDPSSNPIQQISDAAEVIRAKTGKPCTELTLLLSAKAFNAIKNHPMIAERLKFSNQATLTTAYLASLLDIRSVVVGSATHKGEDIWGNDAILAYVAVGSLTNAEPSYGYTYTLRGTPAVLNGYFDESTDSWIYPVNVEATPVMAWQGAGFLFQDCK